MSFKHHLLNPLSDNSALWQEWADLTVDSGELSGTEVMGGQEYRIYDLDLGKVGFRAITTEKKDLVSFMPLLETLGKIRGNLESFTALEPSVEAIRLIDVQGAKLHSLAIDHVFHHSEKQLGSFVPVSFTGWAYSCERQDNPPSVRRPDGKLVTTRGSSIFYNMEGREKHDYVYQLHAEGVESFVWHDFLPIIQVKTTLFRLDNLAVPFYLYITERSLHQADYPRKGEDLMGVMLLFSKLY